MLLVLLAAAGAACGGSTGPGGGEIRGTFRLVRVNGDTLPYPYYHNVVEGRTVEYKVHEARLEFRTRNRVYDIRTLDFLDPRPDTLIAGYSVSGTQLLLTRPTTPAQAAHTDTGSIAGDALTIRIRHLAGTPDVYATFSYVREP
ncbi:MAG TPA: hypothetical protein VK922_12130 [Gemmatimonadaceae bacterium]|nr:hypothetical protein [Gemmatimonadaceae bacterium]